MWLNMVQKGKRVVEITQENNIVRGRTVSLFSSGIPILPLMSAIYGAVPLVDGGDLLGGQLGICLVIMIIMIHSSINFVFYLL